MIDWFNLAANALWILACAMGLTTLGIVHNRAGARRQPFRAALSQPGPRGALSFAGFLFCAGLLLTSDSVFRGSLWAVLALAFIVQWLGNRRPETGQSPE